MNVQVQKIKRKKRDKKIMQEYTRKKTERSEKLYTSVKRSKVCQEI